MARNANFQMEQMRQELSPSGMSKISKVAGTGGSERKKVHAGTYVHDEAYNEVMHDLGPWIETPSSSRVSQFRYDHMNRALQVQWRNNKNHGYIYMDVDYDGYRSFGRVVSKGRHINSTLNNYPYRLMTPEEVQAPSNEDRRGISSRIRT